MEFLSDLPKLPATESDANEMIAQLNRAFASGNSARVSEVLGFIAREYGMTSVADQSGMQRTMLYKTLSAEGNPTLKTLMAVMKVLGIKMTFTRPPTAE